MDGILMQINVESVLAVIAGLAVGIAIAVFVGRFISKAKTRTFQEDLQRQLDVPRRKRKTLSGPRR